MRILDHRYKFYHSKISKLKIFFNLVKLFFYLVTGKVFVVKKFFGYIFALDLKTLLSKVVFVYGVREILDTELVEKEVGVGMHVLEVGANIGYYVLLEASKVGEGGKIFAFEPDPRNLKLLEKNILINNLVEKVKVYNVAAGAQNTTGNLCLYKETNLNNFLSNVINEQKVEGFVKTKIIKLDDFPEINKIDFIRMDVEGYECFVIDGAMGFLKNKSNIKLLIEVHSNAYNKEELDFSKRIKNLAELGFKAKYVISDGSARPQKIISKGYEPIKTATELKENRGLYENIAMGDLIEFLKNKEKIVRSIFLEKNE